MNNPHSQIKIFKISEFINFYFYWIIQVNYFVWELFEFSIKLFKFLINKHNLVMLEIHFKCILKIFHTWKCWFKALKFNNFLSCSYTIFVTLKIHIKIPYAHINSFNTIINCVKLFSNKQWTIKCSPKNMRFFMAWKWGL